MYVTGWSRGVECWGGVWSDMLKYIFGLWFMVYGVISWRSVLLVDETGVSEENHRPVASH